MTNAEIAEPTALVNDEMKGLRPSLTDPFAPASVAIKRTKATSAFAQLLITVEVCSKIGYYKHSFHAVLQVRK